MVASHIGTKGPKRMLSEPRGMQVRMRLDWKGAGCWATESGLLRKPRSIVRIDTAAGHHSYMRCNVQPAVFASHAIAKYRALLGFHIAMCATRAALCVWHCMMRNSGTMSRLAGARRHVALNGRYGVTGRAQAKCICVHEKEGGENANNNKSRPWGVRLARKPAGTKRENKNGAQERRMGSDKPTKSEEQINQDMSLWMRRRTE